MYLKECTYDKTMSEKTNMEKCHQCKPQRKAT